MLLIGVLDSPYVRRVAISLAVLGLPFEHRHVSVFRHFDEFAQLNPIVKAPTLFEDDGTMLIDSTLILDHIDHKVAPACRLMPEEPGARLHALSVIGLALAATERRCRRCTSASCGPSQCSTLRGSSGCRRRCTPHMVCSRRAWLVTMAGCWETV